MPSPHGCCDSPGGRPQKRIEVLGAEVGFFHAHIKGVDWVRRPARGPAAAQRAPARTARSMFLSTHWHGIQERPLHWKLFLS